MKNLITKRCFQTKPKRETSQRLNYMNRVDFEIIFENSSVNLGHNTICLFVNNSKRMLPMVLNCQ